MEEATIIKAKRLSLKWILIGAGVLLVAALAVVIALNIHSRRTTTVSIDSMRDKGWSSATALLDEGGAMIYEQKGEDHFYLVVGKSPDGNRAWRDGKLDVKREGTTLTISLTSSPGDLGFVYPVAIYRLYRDARIDTLHLIVNGEEKSFQTIVACDKLSDYIK